MIYGQATAVELHTTLDPSATNGTYAPQHKKHRAPSTEHTDFSRY